jgi:carbamoyl-phosphate synthase small subunit
MIKLQDGTCFDGALPSWVEKEAFGEVVFTTGMTGYPETLTDPSYAGQIICFTYPLIGNYGVFDHDTWESEKIYARGVIVSQTCENWSHAKGLRSLEDWLKKEGVLLLYDVDTRALTQKIREEGTPLGMITRGAKGFFTNPHPENLVATVSCKNPSFLGSGKKTVIALDCGIKTNILRSLGRFPIQIKKVPHDYDFTNEPYDALFISNGPGDPTECKKTVEHLQKAMKGNKPIFGICLGTQLLALAAGGKTYKLKFGHRGHNVPCQDLLSQKCFITSQNHGYAIDPTSLPKDWQVSWKNLNDGSVEGISHREKPFFSVQFHPEACPGPTDTAWLFEQFYNLL